MFRPSKILLLISLIQLSGCFLACPKTYYTTSTAVIKNDQIVFTDFYKNLSDPNDFKSKDLLITDLQITDFDCASEAGYENCPPLWNISSRDKNSPVMIGKRNKYKEINYITLPENITYGVTIDGMQTISAPKKLKEDTIYFVTTHLYGQLSRNKIAYINNNGSFILEKQNGDIVIRRPNENDYALRRKEKNIAPNFINEN